VDWIISTGANLYHDTHFGIGLAMHQGNAQTSDIVLREEEVVRIYDIFFDYSVLLDTDAFFRRSSRAKNFRNQCLLRSFTIYAAGTCTNASENSVSKESRSSQSLCPVLTEFSLALCTYLRIDSELRSRHWFLKFFARDDLAEKSIGIQQHRVVKENVIDPNHFFFAQHDVRSLRIALVHCQPDPKVRVVIEIGSGGNDSSPQSRL